MGVLSYSLSCFDVAESLLLDGNITVNGMELAFNHGIPPHSRVYNTENGDEAFISYNKKSGTYFGSLKTNEGTSFALEKCRKGYMFKEADISTFPSVDAIESEI